jgi:hypothetical protein
VKYIYKAIMSCSSILYTNANISSLDSPFLSSQRICPIGFRTAGVSI